VKAADIAVVLVAAGRGERAGASAEGPKQYRMIGGKPAISWTIKALAAHPRVRQIIAVIHEDDLELFHQAWPGGDPRVSHVFGGATRQASTRLGLLRLEDDPPAFVMVHDAVRPFVDAALLDRVIGALGSGSGVIPALPVSDTIKRQDGNGWVAETVPRAGLYGAQTPQAFAYQALLDAHEKAIQDGKLDLTDDSSIAENAGMKVKIVEGSPDNLKLTFKRDIDMADLKMNQISGLPDIRTGNGYDVHALIQGSHVTLCGVKIPHTASLSGHSDADVALHAVTDALLATRGAGDIGTHFPPSDAKWRGAASKIFVEHAARLVRGGGGRIANVDITLICEAPKIGPHREAMVAALASMLNIAPERVSVKATTNEKLGFIGRNEGIAAIATASVAYPGFLE
jgi:2-C-methyl-D-erythritol 4-phosphate cytidylyltransferase / 2-C-methyl-D-erythritol 2,4-cyclodiphosphate synthase